MNLRVIETNSLAGAVAGAVAGTTKSVDNMTPAEIADCVRELIEAWAISHGIPPADAIRMTVCAVVANKYPQDASRLVRALTNKEGSYAQ